ncbi:conserved hypothetical protein [Shewanella sediminis HAW-EB3]|uniref:Orotate phosphoribosyltransferase n=2 Tax=Shewanella sediminis TaxID=271097 RepID=A8G1N4_SHESH|nr:conserved hypothetical protein [Shewanella sediminis HAW-EB3]
MTDQAQALTQDEKNMGIVVHVASFAGYIIPFGSVLGPLIVWLMQRDEIQFVDECGRNCLNFKISMMIYVMISVVLMFVGIGFILVGFLAVFDIVVTIIAAMKASEGICYKYPMTIKFIKPRS